jgi:hypothetical protein
MEIWKEIPEHKGYEVSNLGQVRSYFNNSGIIVANYKILKQIVTEKNYRRVLLRKNKKKRIWFVHRVVMLAFVGKIPNKMEVNHINGIKSDNRLENLEYVTRSQNEIHKYRVLKKPTIKWEKSNFAKLTREQAFKIKYEETGFQYNIAKKYGISKGMVCLIKNNKAWVDL